MNQRIENVWLLPITATPCRTRHQILSRIPPPGGPSLSTQQECSALIITAAMLVPGDLWRKTGDGSGPDERAND